MASKSRLTSTKEPFGCKLSKCPIKSSAIVKSILQKIQKYLKRKKIQKNSQLKKKQINYTVLTFFGVTSSLPLSSPHRPCHCVKHYMLQLSMPMSCS